MKDTKRSEEARPAGTQDKPREGRGRTHRPVSEAELEAFRFRGIMPQRASASASAPAQADRADCAHGDGPKNGS